MPSTNMASDWRNRPRAVNSQGAAPLSLQRQKRSPIIMCADVYGLSGASDYAATLRRSGTRFSIWSLALFDDEILFAPLPTDFDPSAGDLLVVPSTRAVAALQAQAWFDGMRDRLRALAPGPETARALEGIGVQVIWTAPRGFRQSAWPEALREADASARRLTIANASLPASALSLPLRAEDWHLPLYQRRPSGRAPWTVAQARGLCQAPRLIVLALSSAQRQVLETRLSLLGRRLPSRRHLIALSPSVAGWSPAVPRRSFWDSVSFPVLPNRASMLSHLQDIAG